MEFFEFTEAELDDKDGTPKALAGPGYKAK